VKILHISCAEEVSAPFIKLVGNEEIYYAFLSSSGGTLKKHVPILPVPEELLNRRSAQVKTLHQWMM